MKNKKIFAVWLGLSILIFAFVNCQGFEAVHTETQNSQSGSPNNPGGSSGEQPGNTTPPSTGGTNGLTVSSIPAANLNLSAEQTYDASVSSINSFSGSVSLSVDRSSLSTVDKDNDVVITIEPSTVSLSANGTANFKVKVVTKPSAPSFDASSIKIVASASGANSVDSSMSIKVNPVVELKMFGGNDAAQRWDQPKMMTFRPHTGGLTLRFINYDTQSTHIVHGGGSIRHQNVGSPLAVATSATQPGGAYEVVINENVTDEGFYYYHDLNDSGNRGIMQFNRNEINLQQAESQRVMASAVKASQDNNQPDVKGAGSCHGGE